MIKSVQSQPQGRLSFFISDLFLLTFIAAAHFAFAKLAASFPEFGPLGWLLIYVASPYIAHLASKRIGFVWATGWLLTWLIVVAWSFLYSMTFSLFYVPPEPDFFTRRTLPEPSRLFNAVTSALGASLLGIIPASGIVTPAD